MDRLRPADEVRATALRVLADQRRVLRAAGVPGELLLVGGSSVAGGLTRGDVDLHLRVPVPAWTAATTRLRELLPVVHPEIWKPTLATFAVPGTPLPTGLAATPAGSEHDLRFTRTWALLRADPQLLARLDAVKRSACAQDYERVKSEFFDDLLRRRPDHPAGGS